MKFTNKGYVCLNRVFGVDTKGSEDGVRRGHTGRSASTQAETEAKVPLFVIQTTKTTIKQYLVHNKSHRSIFFPKNYIENSSLKHFSSKHTSPQRVDYESFFLFLNYSW